MNRPSVFDYLDYRSFFQDMFHFRKKKDKFFSYRYFSKKSGFASPNFLKLVTDGARNLSNESIAKIARGFDLKKQERDFLENLVFMNQATDHDGRNYYYKKMVSAKGAGEIKKIEKASFEYFSKWYYPVIREIVTMGDRSHSPEQIAALLNPSIKVTEAKKALKLLTELGMIHQGEDGRREQGDRAITTGPEVKSLVVANYHRETMKLAIDSMERFQANQRDISALTLGIQKQQIGEIKKRIVWFRKEILDLACEHDSPDLVIQINIQAFPLTRLGE